jgi:DNA-binding MurR/RpiR family transcriptional regulator
MHLKETADMNIRELAAITGVSTTTVLRFCSKVGCEGFTQFRYKIRKMLGQHKENEKQLLDPLPALQFLQQALEDRELEHKLYAAAKLCLTADTVIFIGSGASGSIAEYGAYFLASVGIRSTIIKDVFYPLPAKDVANTVVIALSVTGESRHLVFQLDGYKKKRTKIISITNTNHNTIASISEINFSYFMLITSIITATGEGISMTTQIPALYLLEALTDHIYRQQQRKEEEGDGD